VVRGIKFNSRDLARGHLDSIKNHFCFNSRGGDGGGPGGGNDHVAGAPLPAHHTREVVGVKARGMVDKEGTCSGLGSCPFNYLSLAPGSAVGRGTRFTHNNNNNNWVVLE